MKRPGLLRTLFGTTNKIQTYGTPGSQFNDMMVGGRDVEVINEMLETAFEQGRAGIGEQKVIKVGTFKGKNVFEQKAADTIRISLDDNGRAYVKLIIREDDLGLGLIALSGGFQECKETDEQAAKREEDEEAKSKTGLTIKEYKIPLHPVRGDVRVWRGENRSDGVKNGDIIAMSTAAIIKIVKNAHDGAVEAKDDAAEAAWVPLSAIDDANVFGAKDHATMLLEATKLAGVSDQLPKNFTRSLSARQNDISISNKKLRSTSSILLNPAPKIEVCPTPKNHR